MATKLDVLEFTGTSGGTYRFHFYVWQSAFRALPAVYIVTERSVEPNAAPAYKPLFVGTTDDMSRVFAAHPCQDCFDLYYANTIGVLTEQNEVMRRFIEQDLIGSLELPCNDREDRTWTSGTTRRPEDSRPK